MWFHSIFLGQSWWQNKKIVIGMEPGIIQLKEFWSCPGFRNGIEKVNHANLSLGQTENAALEILEFVDEGKFDSILNR